MRHPLIALVLAGIMAFSTAGVAQAAHRDPATGVQTEPIVQEWNFDGTPNDDRPRVGSSQIRRRSDGLGGSARITGLRPGGAYTFWWVVVQRDGVFPSDIFVAYGAGAVADDHGRARIRMSARRGQPGIEGFTPDGVNEIAFASLDEPLTATVRIEIAYHGQAEEAGNELAVWLSDFWTGSACPPVTANPNAAQPHCPIYYAATHPAGT